MKQRLMPNGRMVPKPAWTDSHVSVPVAGTTTHNNHCDDNNANEEMDTLDLSVQVNSISPKNAGAMKYTDIYSSDITYMSRKLEHSFSQSDLFRFNIAKHKKHVPKETENNSIRTDSIPSADNEISTSINGLRADFVHLHGLYMHGESIKKELSLYSEGREGFKLRSFCSFYVDDENVSKNTKTVVVVPSIDLDRSELNRMSNCIEFFEERQLYHLLLTRDPSIRIIYLSSNRVNERVVRYYLNLSMSQDDESRVDSFSDAHNKLSRVFMISVPSGQYIPLTEKILQERKLLNFLKDLIESPLYDDNAVKNKPTKRLTSNNASAGLSVFTGSDAVDKVSHELGIRLLEAHGHQLHYGTKQGSREIFAACGIPFPAGTPDLSAGDDDLLTYGALHGEEDSHWAYHHRYIRSAKCLAIGLARQIVRGVHPKKWVVKLNQGFGGKSNASINLQKFQTQQKTSTHEIDDDHILRMACDIEKQFEISIKCEDPSMSWHGDAKNFGYKKQIERLGVIAEAFVEGDVPTSPSIQAVIEPDDSLGKGKVSIISTHEQLLNGQVFQGCINPASEMYRRQIMEMGLKVGKFMAEHGVVGHFSVDFLATQKSNGSFDLNAVEVNLRQGGTTHPQATMALLCGGCICSDGLFRTNNNEVRMYVATDNHSNPKLIGCSQNDLVDAIECKTNPLASKIHWNKRQRIGVVFHLFKLMECQGRIGFTAIGRTSEESEKLFNETVEFLDDFGSKYKHMDPREKR